MRKRAEPRERAWGTTPRVDQRQPRGRRYLSEISPAGRLIASSFCQLIAPRICLSFQLYRNRLDGGRLLPLSAGITPADFCCETEPDVEDAALIPIPAAGPTPIRNIIRGKYIYRILMPTDSALHPSHVPLRCTRFKGCSFPELIATSIDEAGGGTSFSFTNARREARTKLSRAQG